MNARRIGMLAAVFTLVASGAYVFIYLVPLGVEPRPGLGRHLHRRRDRHDRLDPRRPDAPHRPPPRPRSARGRAAPPARHPHDALRPRGPTFAWLTRTDRSNVFIPVLLGAGAVLSALAWVVERVARATAGRAPKPASPVISVHSTCRHGGLLDGGLDPLALLRGPQP